MLNFDRKWLRMVKKFWVENRKKNEIGRAKYFGRGVRFFRGARMQILLAANFIIKF